MEQEKVWDNISEEWHEFKTTPSLAATEFLNKSKGKILDFGSGSGRNLLEITDTKEKELYLVDFSNKMLELAKERAKERGLNVETKQSKNEEIPYSNEFFDAVICVATIHCIETKEKREKIIQELYRVLKPGSKIEIEVWDKNSERFKKAPKEKFIAWRDKGKRYYYLYEKQEIQELFKKAGFKIIEEKPHKANIIFIAQK